MIEDRLPDKINEKPTIWLGLTMSELLRIGVSSFLVLLVLMEILMGLPIGGIKGMMIGLMVASALTIGAIFVLAKILSATKQGKPYGYSDQKFQLSKWRFLGFQFKKVPCETRKGTWINRKIGMWE